jgi:hypothetical protein
MGISATDDNQRRRFDFMNKVSGLMALPGNDVAQIAFKRWHLVDNELLKFFHNLGMLLHELIRKHEAGSPVVVLVFLIALLNHFQGRVQRNSARVIFKLIAVFSRAGPGQNQAANFLGIVQSDPLEHPRSHRVAHHMGFLDPQGVH